MFDYEAAMKGVRLRSHLDDIAEAAGLDVMNAEDGVLGIIDDRCNVPSNDLLRLTQDNVRDLYEGFIAPAIDALEDYLVNGAQKPEAMNIPDASLLDELQDWVSYRNIHVDTPGIGAAHAAAWAYDLLCKIATELGVE